MLNFKLVRVKEQSMEPTLKENDLLLTKTNCSYHSLHRNDIIIFNSPVEKNLKLVKRIIGLEGDSIQIYSNGVLVVNKKENSEQKLELENEWIEFEWNLEPNQIIILSDNREKRHDSRIFGPIEFNAVISKVVFSVKPFKRLKKNNYLN